MYSVGIDTVEIERIERSVKRDSFVNRVYGDDELAEIKKRREHPRSFAVCFAAKEAFSKALGTGIAGFSLNDVQLLHNEKGAPYLKLSGKALEMAGDLGFSVSVTHTDSIVTVIVLAYGE